MNVTSRTTTKTSVPKTYTEFLVFLFSGTGVWAMLLGLIVPLFMKAALDLWAWTDAVVLVCFVLFRGIFEWLIHYYLYHAEPLPIFGLRLESPVSKAHLDHHARPHDIDTLLITWKGVVAVLVGTFFVMYLLWGLGPALMAVTCFALIGLFIEVVHLLCHCQIPHRNRYINNIVMLHRAHHWQVEDSLYGVSSSLGDRLFGTYKELASNE